MTSASDIIRSLVGKITVGEKVIELVEETHKSILVALMNLATSTVGNSDAVASAELINEFISDVKVAELKDYTFSVSDGVKTAEFNGLVLRTLASVWGECKVEWHVVRGGKRSVTKDSIISLSDMANFYSAESD